MAYYFCQKRLPAEEAMGKVNGKSEDEKTEIPKEDIIFKANMHCKGCANKVMKILRGFDGVEEVEIDGKNSKVTVKGEKADPMKVFERLKKIYGKNVELISPIPNPKQPEEEKKEEIEEPKVMIVVLKVSMHCQRCAIDIKKTILKVEGVRTVEADRKESTVTVKGVFDPQKLVDHLHKQGGKYSVILKQYEEEKEKKKPKKKKKKKEEKEMETNDIKEGIEENWGNENENDSYFFNYHSQYPCQCFSEENSNACSIL